MRQYVIYYKRGQGDYARLQPIVHSGLYSKPEVTGAINHMRETPSVAGICVQIEDEMWNIMGFKQDAIAPNAFAFEDGPIVPNEPVGA